MCDSNTASVTKRNCNLKKKPLGSHIQAEIREPVPLTLPLSGCEILF